MLESLELDGGDKVCSRVTSGLIIRASFVFCPLSVGNDRDGYDPNAAQTP